MFKIFYEAGQEARRGHDRAPLALFVVLIALIVVATAMLFSQAHLVLPENRSTVYVIAAIGAAISVFGVVLLACLSSGWASVERSSN